LMMVREGWLVHCAMTLTARHTSNMRKCRTGLFVQPRSLQDGRSKATHCRTIAKEVGRP
jgi:hypothetical protein